MTYYVIINPYSMLCFPTVCSEECEVFEDLSEAKEHLEYLIETYGNKKLDIFECKKVKL